DLFFERRAGADESTSHRVFLLPLTEVQRVSLVVLYGELPRAPGSLVHVLHEANTLLLQSLGGRRGIVGLEIEMEVLAVVDELDRRVFLVDELEVKELAARPDSRVEVLILELERQSHRRGVEAHGLGEIRRPQLGDHACYRHRPEVGVFAIYPLPPAVKATSSDIGPRWRRSASRSA